MGTSTYLDWNPKNVDLLTLDQIASRTGLSLPELQKMISYDSSFPFSREVNGCQRWRQWQVDLYFEGAYYDEGAELQYSTRAA